MGGTGKSCKNITMIGVLPDDVLLEIFDFYRSNHDFRSFLWDHLIWNWHILVHVCQRWRQIIFASPLRLSVRILCTDRTPVRKNLDIWPALPIVIGYEGGYGTGLVHIELDDEDNVFAALEHTGRVCEVRLRVTGPQLGRIAKAMQEPFPALKQLSLISGDRDTPVIPGAFLGRSAPCLQKLILAGIPCPALPILLPSASDLATLELRDIPYSGYISPEAMVAALATLTRLRDLRIGFQSPNSRPDQIRLSPEARTVLAALTTFGGLRGTNRRPST